MDGAEFEAFGERARVAVERKLAAIHERYGLVRAVRWEMDEPRCDAPRIRIFDADDTVLFDCAALEIGTFDPASSTWKWGWANGSLSDAQRERLRPLRDLAEITGRAAFQFEDPFETDVASAWTIAAMAAEHLGAAGCYDARIKNLKGEVLHAYLAYMGVPDIGQGMAPSALPPHQAAAAELPDDAPPAEVLPPAEGAHTTAQDRPRGMVSFNVAMREAEILFFERCLKTLDRDPSFEDLDDDLRRAFGATPERPLGELQPLSHKLQRVPVSFRFRGKDGDPDDICDITSLNVDIAALAMLIAVAVPSAHYGGFGYTPMSADFDSDDPRLVPQPEGGVVKITPGTVQIFDTDVPPAHESRRWTYHVP